MEGELTQLSVAGDSTFRDTASVFGAGGALAGIGSLKFVINGAFAWKPQAKVRLTRSRSLLDGGCMYISASLFEDTYATQIDVLGAASGCGPALGVPRERWHNTIAASSYSASLFAALQGSYRASRDFDAIARDEYTPLRYRDWRPASPDGAVGNLAELPHEGCQLSVRPVPSEVCSGLSPTLMQSRSICG